jgi:hydroxymethylbilane synthase
MSKTLTLRRKFIPQKYILLENKNIIIGTRGSKLALWQADYLQQQLKAIGVQSELKIIQTQGDRIQHLGFDKMEGKGFFTKELEDALLRGDIDMAVHSMKDMPTRQPEGLVITAVSYRENPADWLVVRKESIDENQIFDFKINGVVGTSSARRKAQLLDFRPDAHIQDIRGNVPTRLEKLRKGDFDAIFLAAAGLQRLQLDISDFHLVKLNPREFVPAPAQGVLAFQTTAADVATRRILKNLHRADTALVTNIERKTLQLMEGGCQMPLGVYCERDTMGNYHVWSAIATAWNAPVRRVRISQNTSFELAEAVASALKNEK